MLLLIILSIIGFVLSCYAYMIEWKFKKVPGYKPLCDISERVSCLKPLTSSFANIFYFSNAIFGMLFYLTVVVLAFFNIVNFLFILSVFSLIMTIALAYLLYFKVKSFCLICSLIYIVNFMIFASVSYKFFLG